MLPSRPYDAEIEYLEKASTNNIATYIDTGIVPNINTRCEIDLVSTTFYVWFGILGSATSDNNADSWVFRGNGTSDIAGYSFRIDGKAIDNQILVPIGTRAFCTASKESFACVVGGTTTTKSVGATSYSSQPTLTMFLFSVNLNGSPWLARNFCGRIYSCKIYDGDTVVRDFIPVRVGDVGYMYDRVSKQLFGNKGTGNFTLGPDKSKPVISLFNLKPTASNYVRNGLIAMWDGIENAGFGKHVASPSVWKDCINGLDATPTSDSYSWKDTYVSTTNTCVFTTSAGIGLTKATVQILVKTNGWNYSPASALGSFGYGSLDKDGNVNNGGITVGMNSDTHVTWYASSPWSRRTVNIGINRSNVILHTIVWYGGGKPALLYAYDMLKDTNESSTLGKNMLSFCIGATHSVGNESMYGDFYSVRIYDRALSQSEIAANYAIDKRRFNLP